MWLSRSESAEGQVRILLDENMPLICSIPPFKSDVKYKFEFSSRSYCMIFQSLQNFRLLLTPAEVFAWAINRPPKIMLTHSTCHDQDGTELKRKSNFQSRSCLAYM